MDEELIKDYQWAVANPEMVSESYLRKAEKALKSMQAPASVNPPIAPPPAQPQGGNWFTGTLLPDAAKYGQDALSGAAQLMGATPFTETPATFLYSAVTQDGPQRQALSNVGQHFGGLFSNPEYAMRNLRTRPVQTLADYAVVPGLMGSLPGRAGTVGRALQNIDPITGLTTAGEMMVGGSAASKIAPKFSKATDGQRTVNQFTENLNRMLDESITPDVAGTQRMNELLGEARGGVQEAMEWADLQATQTGNFKLEDIYAKLDDMVEQRFKASDDYDAVKADIEKAKETLRRNSENGEIKPSTLNKLKTEIDNRIANAQWAGTSTASPADKYRANVYRGMVNEEFPGVADANRRAKELYDVQKMSESTGVNDLFGRGPLRSAMSDVMGSLHDAGGYLLTGKGSWDRAMTRRMMETNDWKGLAEMSGYTPIGYSRAASYNTGDEDRWHVGRLWEE